jgi:hypothetical protein
MLYSVGKDIYLVAPRVPRYPYSNSLYIEDERPMVIDFGPAELRLPMFPTKKSELRMIQSLSF